MKRTATAEWNGTLKEGKGTISTQSTTLDNTQYSFKARFEDGTGTNPEELIGAAHAGCFTMALSAILSGEGHTPGALKTQAVVELNPAEQQITGITLKLKASPIDGLTEAQFSEIAEKAKTNCPISKALSATPMTLEVTYEA